MVMAAAPANRKRLAPGCTAAGGGSKRARITLGSIYDYEKLEVIGEGSFGVVIKARHRGTGEAVAVKRARGTASDLRAVLREAGCLASCRGHPSVVGIRDVVQDPATGHVFLVMEFVGASLRRLLRPSPASPPARFTEAGARAVMRQLLRGAERMHGAGIIHRDIKPDNILVSPGPGGAAVVVKICDMGLATPARNAACPYPERRVGTLLYRSPEQLAGRRDYGAGVDIWALGCVMAELLTGELMFDAGTEDALLARVTELGRALAEKGMRAFDEWPAFRGLPEMSSGAREVLAGLLAVDPRDRLTATAALRHPWFAEGEEEEQSPAAASCGSAVRAARSCSASVVTVVV